MAAFNEKLERFETRNWIDFLDEALRMELFWCKWNTKDMIRLKIAYCCHIWAGMLTSHFTNLKAFRRSCKQWITFKPETPSKTEAMSQVYRYFLLMSYFSIVPQVETITDKTHNAIFIMSDHPQTSLLSAILIFSITNVRKHENIRLQNLCNSCYFKRPQYDWPSYQNMLVYLSS